MQQSQEYHGTQEVRRRLFRRLRGQIEERAFCAKPLFMSGLQAVAEAAVSLRGVELARLVAGKAYQVDEWGDLQLGSREQYAKPALEAVLASAQQASSICAARQTRIHIKIPAGRRTVLCMQSNTLDGTPGPGCETPEDPSLIVPARRLQAKLWGVHACQAVEDRCRAVSAAAEECAGSLRGEAELRDRTGADLGGGRRPMSAVRAEKLERARRARMRL